MLPLAKDTGQRRAQELLQLQEHIHLGAIAVIQAGEASGAVRRKLLEDVRTANYVMKKALDALSRWAHKD